MTDITPFTSSERFIEDPTPDNVAALVALRAGDLLTYAHHRNMSDNVNYPKHYRSHPSGVECIQITEHMGFCLGNAIKYIWRADLKADAIEDLRKARWYIDREIARRMHDNPSCDS